LPKSAKNQLEISAFTNGLRAIAVPAVMDTGGVSKIPLRMAAELRWRNIRP